jgi:hypothetical protein
MEAALNDRARNVEDQRVWQAMVKMKQILTGSFELNEGKPTLPGRRNRAVAGTRSSTSTSKSRTTS